MGVPIACGQYGVCATCYPSCNGEVVGTCNLTDIPEYQSKEQKCNDNLDNDCDNKSDCEDTDCHEFLSCSCGNGICDANLTESCNNCPDDCSNCSDGSDGSDGCGDGKCSSDEDCETCAQDCGPCNVNCSSCGCNCGECDLECCPEDLINDFDDVPKNHEYYYQIKAMKRFKLSTGCKTQPFLYCPDRPLTRGESAVFISRGLCFGPPWKESPAPFTDVPEGHFWIGEIWALKEKGISAGKEDGTFGVDEAINRADLVIFLAKSLNIQPDSSGASLFSDLTDSKVYYYGYIQAYARAGKIPNCNPNSGSCGLFFKGPDKLIPRGEASNWVVTAYGLKTEK